MKKLFFIFLIISINATAQVHLDYPKNQDPYKGGFPQFYKELKEIISKKNIVCNEKEVLYAKVLIEPDATVKYVVEPDTLAIHNNKCTYNLLKESLKELKNWTPATFNGLKEKAIARFVFSPSDIIGNNFLYTVENATFPGGLENFRKKFIGCVDLRRFSSNGKVRFIMDFEVNTQGKIQNVFVDTFINNEDFMNMILDCLKTSKKNTWAPAMYKGTEIVQRFKFPITINFE